LGLEFVSHFPEWHHILFKVKDADLSIRFYSDYLGMAAVLDQRDTDGKRWVWLRFTENPYSPYFVLLEDGRFQKGNITGSLQMLSFRMTDMKPVEEIGAKAKNENCLVEGAKYGGHMRGYYCLVSDPDGNVLEFAYVMSPKPGGAQ
jgi:catechol 2,3-dioxygenase-like lactoylglutathione lyase family enzyme